MLHLRKIVGIVLSVLLVLGLTLPALAAQRNISNVIVIMPPSNPKPTPAPEIPWEPEATATPAPENPGEPGDTEGSGSNVEGDTLETPASTTGPDAPGMPTPTPEPEVSGEPDATGESDTIEDSGDTGEFGDAGNPDDAGEPDGTEGPEKIEDPEEKGYVEIEFPDNGSVSIEATVRQMGEELAYGDHVRMHSSLFGLDGYKVGFQWQQCKQGGEWFDIADAHDSSLTFIMTEDNAHDNFRLMVKCYAKVVSPSAQLDLPKEAA